MSATLVASSGAYTIVGQASARAFDLGVASGSYTLTGQTASTKHGYKVIATAGMYTLTGQAVNANRISAAPGGYLVTGQPVTFLYRNRILALAAGSYALTGQTTTKLEHAVPSDLGAYALTGTAATLSRSGSPVLSIGGGSYGLTGTAATLLYTQPINSGDYNITGTAANLIKGKGIVAGSRAFIVAPGPQALTARGYKFSNSGGSYTYTGNVATLIYSNSHSKVLAIDFGTFVLSGQTVSLKATRLLSAASGSYTYTGMDTEAHSVAANTGTYGYTGTAATLKRDRVLGATAGSYSIVAPTTIIARAIGNLVGQSTAYALFGFPAAIRATRIMSATSGAYTLASPGAFLRATRLVVDPGVYSLTGTAATLIASRTGRWRTSPKQPKMTKKQPHVTPQWDEQGPEPGVHE